MLLLAGLGVPSELYVAEIGPAPKVPNQIMISLTLEPPTVDEVNKSKATFATMDPEVVCDHLNVDWEVELGSEFMKISCTDVVPEWF